MKQKYQKQPEQSFLTPSTVDRRRVVKGLAGLPAMVTLASGSALANASSQQCVTKDVVPEEVSCTNYPGPDTGLTFDGDRIYGRPGQPAYAQVSPNRFCPVYVDSNGSLFVKENNDQTPGNPVYTSCMVSFANSAV
jgi:hypothetical protein